MSEPLTRAAYEDRPTVVQALLASGADVAAADHLGQTALHWAARQGHEAVTQVLLEAAAPVGVCSKDGSTPLHLAAEAHAPAVVRLLLAHRADAAAKARTGRTALHLAAEKGSAESVAAMLEVGDSAAMLTLLDSRGEKPLMTAASRGHGSVIEVLVNARADPACQNRWGCTALQKAVAGGHGSAVAALLDGGADACEPARNGSTPLQTAAEQGDLGVMEALLSRGVDAMTRMSGGRTALHIAAERGLQDAAALLVRKRADVNARADEAQTPLAFAAVHGHAAIVERLLESGANPWAADDAGHMPLHAAVAQGRVEVADMLIQHSAPIDAPDAAGRTPALLAVAARQDKALRLLLRNGASLPEEVTQKTPALSDVVAEVECEGKTAPQQMPPLRQRAPAASGSREAMTSASTRTVSASVSDKASGIGSASQASEPPAQASAHEDHSARTAAQAESVKTMAERLRPACTPCSPSAEHTVVIPNAEDADEAVQADEAEEAEKAEELNADEAEAAIVTVHVDEAVKSEDSEEPEESEVADHGTDSCTAPPSSSASSRSIPGAGSEGGGRRPRSAMDEVAEDLSAQAQQLEEVRQLMSSLSEAADDLCDAEAREGSQAAPALHGRALVGQGFSSRAIHARSEARKAALEGQASCPDDKSHNGISSTCHPRRPQEEASQDNFATDLLEGAGGDNVEKSAPGPEPAAKGGRLQTVQEGSESEVSEGDDLGSTDEVTPEPDLACKDQDGDKESGNSNASSADLANVGLIPGETPQASSLGLTFQMLQEAAAAQSLESLNSGRGSRKRRSRLQHSNRQPSPKESFFEVMRRKGEGSMVVAWRRYFDVDGDGDLDFQEFCSALTGLGFRGDVIDLWKALDPTASSRLSLELFDPEAAKLINEMGKWCTEKLGGPTEVFKEIDGAKTGVLTRQGLVAGLRRLGLFTDDSMVSEALQSEEGFLRHMYPVIDIWGHDLVSEEDFLFLELDKQKNRQLKRKFAYIAERGKLPSSGEHRSAASHLLSNLAKHSTPLGGKNWKQAGRAIDKHLGPAPTDLGPMPVRRRPKRSQRPSRLAPSESAPQLCEGLQAESEAASSWSGSARAKELAPSVSLPKLLRAPSVAGTDVSMSSSVHSKQRQRVRNLYSRKQVTQLPSVAGQSARELPTSQQPSANTTKEAERRLRRQVDFVGQRSLEVLGPSKHEDFFNPATALGLFQHYYNIG